MTSKKYRTNRDTISLNAEMFCSQDPLFPYNEEHFSQHTDSSMQTLFKLLDLTQKLGTNESKFSKEEYDKILCETRASTKMGTSLHEVYAIKGKKIVNLVNERDGNILFLRLMKIRPEAVTDLLNDLRLDSRYPDYLTLLSLFTSQMRYDQIREETPGYRRRLKTVKEEVNYHPKGMF
jgi:hypothetical protein